MARYIDAEQIQYRYLPNPAIGDVYVTKTDIMNMPEADVQDVKHRKPNIIKRTKFVPYKAAIDESGHPFIRHKFIKYESEQCPFCGTIGYFCDCL